MDLSAFTTIGIGPVADVFIIRSDKIYPKNHTILGHGSNLLISDTPPKLMMLSKEFDYIKQDKDTLIIGGATVSGKIVSFCKKHDIAQFEFLLKLPGNLGGMVKMNAGLKEFEIFNALLGIVTKEGYISKDNIEHSYRHTAIDDVIFEAHFAIEKGFDQQRVEFFQKMRDNQPNVKSAGSCFKNPKGDFAARLIEDVGLKGVFEGDMGFSPQHANFLMNKKNGTFDQALNMIQKAQERVKKKHGITLETEITILS